MTIHTGKTMPFLVLTIAVLMLGVDTFTEFTISAEMVNFAELILIPLGLGGLVNKGWNVYKEVKIKS